MGDWDSQTIKTPSQTWIVMQFIKQEHREKQESRAYITNTRTQTLGILEAAVFRVHLGTVLSEASFSQVGFQSLTLGALNKYVWTKVAMCQGPFVTQLTNCSLQENSQFFPKETVSGHRYSVKN